MRGKIQKKIDLLLSLLIIVMLLPLLVATIGQRMQLETLIHTDDTGAEDQLIGIVAKEISADAPEEAICAQCVIARTNLYDAQERGTRQPEALDRKALRTLWGEQFEECYERIKHSVEHTGEEVLVWNGEYAYAAYHAISAGSTRNMAELYPDASLPYIQAQMCEKDVVAEGYLSVSYLEKNTFIEKCVHLAEGEEIHSLEEVQVEARDTAGYVTKVKVGTKICEGEAFREEFGLNSACFAFTELDGNIRFVTKGLGHGFGLSQNTANAMAEEGNDYTEILAYFYPGTNLCNDADRK